MNARALVGEGPLSGVRSRSSTSWAALVAVLAAVGACDGPEDGRAPAPPGETGSGPETNAAAGPAGPVAPSGDRSGEALAGALGCGACHAGVPAPASPAPALESGRLEPAWVFGYLGEPGAHESGAARRGARMPDFHLDAAERLALALYLGGEGSGDRGRSTDPRRRPDEAMRDAFREARSARPELDADRGRRVFRALNCAGCHPGTDVPPWQPGPDLASEPDRARASWLRDWLRDPVAIRPFGHRPGTGSRMPHFRLSPEEADSLTAYLLRRGGDDRPLPSPLSANSPGPATSDGSVAGGPSPGSYREWKARRLLERRLSCLGCHRLGAEGGRIGPALDRVAVRRPRAWIETVVRDPGATTRGTVMPDLPLEAPTLELLVDFLAAPVGEDGEWDGPEREPHDDPRSGYLSLVDHPLLPPADPEAVGRRDADAAGGGVYRERCAACHGEAGRADGYNARYLPVTPTAHASAEHMSTRPSSTLFDGVHAGGRILGKSPRMPAFGGSLDRETVWDLVAHMRALCGCVGPGWSRDNDEEVPTRVRRAASAAGGGPP